MILLRNTILICLLLTPVVVYAFSKQPEDTQEIESPIGVEIVEEPTYDYTIADFKRYAEVKVTEKWGSEEVNAFKRIISKESSWIHNKAHYSNGKSSATGFGGFLNATWETVGCEKTYDQFVQIDCTIKYIEQRYDTPVKALEFHNLKGWY